MNDSLDDRLARLHEDAPLVDVDVHPSLKAYLFRRNLWRHYWSGKTFDPFSSRSDYAAAFLLVPVYRKLTRGSIFQRLLEMMDGMEREVRRRPERVELARSAADVVRIREAWLC